MVSPAKRTRKATAAEAAAATAGAPLKTPMEESADALAGVEGALTGSKRKAPATTSRSPTKKKSATKSPTTSATKSERPRSNSIERLSEVADSLLKDDLTSSISVPNPMAAAAAVAVAAAASAAKPVISTTVPLTSGPTGFSKRVTVKTSSQGTQPKNAPKIPPPDGQLKNKKTQITYNPDIPMTKEQLTAWRREMRRVRNRESAAASRRKVRDRIEELEEEVNVWKRRYQEVSSRLAKAEGKKGAAKKNAKSEEGSGDV